jgi:hypothetical protein
MAVALAVGLVLDSRLALRHDLGVDAVEMEVGVYLLVAPVVIFDGELGDGIGGNLDGFIWVLVGIPLLGLPFGVIGAALGARPWRRRA